MYFGDKMDVFISYSSINRQTAHLTQASLTELGLTSFMAHEDLEVSDEWRDAIIGELKVAGIFVALLSAEFMASPWCVQEVGFIISRPDVLIIPLSLDGTVASGFIARLQSRKVIDADILSRLESILYRKRTLQMIPNWIRRVGLAGSFRGAESILEPMAPYFDRFSVPQAESFFQAALSNNQVWWATRARSEFLPAFARIHWTSISRPLKDLYLQRLEVAESDVQAV